MHGAGTDQQLDLLHDFLSVSTILLFLLLLPAFLHLVVRAHTNERESVCVCVRAKETVCFLFWGFFSFEGLATLLMYPGLRACLLFPFLAALSSWIARPCREDGGAPAARCGEGQRR